LRDLLKKAASYIAIAESQDSRREAYIRAADAIIEWLAEDPARRGHRQAGEGIGRSASYVGKLVTWRTSGDPDTSPSPFGTEAQREARDRYEARRALQANPDLVKQHIIDNPEIARKAARESSAVADAAGTGSLERGAEEFRARNPEGHDRMTRLMQGAADELQQRVLSEAAGNIRKAIISLQFAIKKIKDDKFDREQVEAMLPRLELHVDLLKAALGHESHDWDVALERLTSEE
jgi:hypothetical protein